MRNRARPQPTWRKPWKRSLLDRKPDLVIWQTGTVDAMRGVDPESFRTSLDEGIDHIVDAGADLILMNMQYSPRTETMISLSNYADIMRVVARDREVPLFDRREIMRYWNDNGNFDLNLATKDLTTAYKVHDCLGRALASLVIEAGQSRRHQSETDAVMVFRPPFSHFDICWLTAACLAVRLRIRARRRPSPGAFRRRRRTAPHPTT